MTYDVVLTRRDGSVKANFRIYDWPPPGVGKLITLPYEGRMIKVRVISVK